MDYASQLIDWLHELGYTHCFFVAGGNIMHLLNAARTRMVCIPFVHEVDAGIAAEYHNEASPGGTRAFAMVTSGPGVTNILTAMAGAWLESRDLLVLAGQVKRSDLSRGEVRQRGIQEVDGVALARPVTVLAERLDEAWPRQRFRDAVERGRAGRKAPVFLEIPLDVQGGAALPALPGSIGHDAATSRNSAARRSEEAVPEVARRIRAALRPIVLLGGGITRTAALALAERLREANVAVMTTWNGADRVDSHDANYFGRPNTWGMRYSNVLLAQADLVVVLGSRLGLQQTGFNWQQFAPAAEIVQFDIDETELRKGHPRVALAIAGDANTALRALLWEDLGEHADWLAYARHVRGRLPLAEPGNETAAGYIDPFTFVEQLSNDARADDIIVPCSSGGAFTTMLQAFRQRRGQIIITNKGLASMGYGLGGAIGAASANLSRRTLLIEGDGGFAQNVQELSTLAVNAFTVKIFIYSNEGYASVRLTQRNYFGGAYMGCDVSSGLGFPRWPELFAAYRIETLVLDESGLETPGCRELLERPGPAAFIVPIDPEQTYYPKIASRVTETGSMESSPLHLMTPELAPDVAWDTMRYVKETACRALS